MNAQKNILITGASGGLGEATIKKLKEYNWKIYASDNNENILEKYNQDSLVTPLLIDVTNQNSIDKAFEYISEKTSGLDAIANIAGVLRIGSVAEVPVDDVQNILQINLLGIYRINQRFLPLILNRKGRIINISSETGWQTAAPFNGVYALSKHAVEAYSDALRRELAFLDVKVIKIQPGPLKTAMTKQVEYLFVAEEKKSGLFKAQLSKALSYLPSVYKNAASPTLFAQTVLKALSDTNPKSAYSIKPDKARSFLEKLPVKWADGLIKRALDK